MFKLVIQDDEGKTTVVPLIRDEITIGRKEGNTIRLTERNVSRRHARIMRQNTAVEIEDLDSYNGIFINGNKLDGRIKLGEADRVQIGDYLIELKSDAPSLSTEQKTQPMERIDPMANTPVPEMSEQSDSEALTVPVETAEPEAGAETDAAKRPNGHAVEAPGAAPGPAYPKAEADAAAALADTDPGARTAAEIARLVVVSNNFAGEEFSLDKPASVIGRTDDNDIVVNHRSISRHHAKVVRENGRYAIVDLQSSNGVRVNGEDYGKVELRRGDNIDLGHVRLRFVEAGEDFVLGRDAEIVDLAAAAAGGGRGFMWAAVAVLVVGGVVAALLMRGDPEPTTTGSAAGVVEGTAAAPGQPTTAPIPEPSAPVVEPAPTPTPVPVPTPAGETGDADLRAKLDAARAAVLEEKWDVARDLADEALALDATSVEAKQLREQATREIANELQFARFQQAIAAQEWQAVPVTLAKIDRNSAYRPRAQEMHDAARSQYSAEVKAQAQTFARAGNCKAIVDMAKRARLIWPEAGDAASGSLAECRASARAPAPRRKPPRDEPPVVEPDPDPVPRVSAQQLQQQSQQEYMRGNYGKAYKLCEDALEQNPRDAQARITCVLAACKMRNTKRAAKHYERLTSDRQRMAYQQCKRSGVEFP